MKIEGNKIGIRKFQTDDIAPFHMAVKESVEHLHEFMPWCHPEYSIQESKLWVESRGPAWDSGQDYSFIVYSTKDHELLGGVDINQINSSHKVGNIGYWVRKKSLRLGVATEAVSLISGFGFGSLELNRLEIVMLPNNVASRKVAEKSGAKYEGVLQKRLLVRGEALDACMYSLVKHA
ncbi:MAG: GNAT family N-acetyltransferase [Ectothiorhodospiraceae bacterium]|nr:GNAT family N-acetyltransferase [Ectothiorhodospiraceae bacterium]